MTGDQFFGIAACITAFGAVSGPIVTAIIGRKVADRVDAVHAEVKTGNGHTLGELAEAAEARDTGEPPAPPVAP